METALPASANTHNLSSPPIGYQALGKTGSIEKDTSKVCLRAGSATVEVTALAPDLFRVGLFPDGRPVRYDSYAVVTQNWEPGTVTLAEDEAELAITTSFATAHFSLNPLRIGFTDQSGRSFATDDPELGMGWFPSSEQSSVVSLANAVGTLGTPLRIYKRHNAREHYFGCGERTGELDKTGTRQLFWNVDPPPGHTVLQNNLYVSIPFTLVLADGQAWGFFLDNPGRIEFDLAHDHPQRSWFGTDNGDLVYYVFCGPTPRDVLARYTDLTGRTPLAPLWSLGNGQSRFSYETADEVRHVARTFRERDIPCDTLYLDIDTLDGYRVFTWDRNNFPDPEGLFAELGEMGFHIVGIVDAGVKVDENFPVYTEGRALDLYCKSSKGVDYQNAVWPGVCVFPDFMNPEAREWWGNQHRPLLDAGVTGIWSDMNEPALFLPVHATMPPDVIHPSGGEARLHIQVHNAYGSLMVQAAREGLLRLRPEKRPFVISRAGYAGVQRHALIWTGDNSSTWEHLTMSLPQLLNLGLSGVGWCGVDIGGYYGDTSGELLARWTEFGIFQSFCRNHSEKQTRHQEPWMFGEVYESVCRAMLKLRYRLLPYLYTAFEECNRTGTPLLRPLFWASPEDTATYVQEDEALCGDALLVAPITRPGIEYRHVYVPAGSWFHFWTGERIDGPAHILAHAPLGQPAFYVRSNSAIPLMASTDYVGQKKTDRLTLLIYPCEGSGETTFYEDAGDGYEQENGVYARRFITCEVEDGNIRVLIGAREGLFVPARQIIQLELREVSGEPQTVLLGNDALPWRYDADQRSLMVDLAETAQELDLSLRF